MLVGMCWCSSIVKAEALAGKHHLCKDLIKVKELTLWVIGEQGDLLRMDGRQL